jgi:hypothetical protein
MNGSMFAYKIKTQISQINTKKSVKICEICVLISESIASLNYNFFY